MMPLNLRAAGEGPLKVLCLGSHSDDIEIGCGGTILRFVEQYPNIQFYWAVFNACGVRREEAQRAAECFAGTARLQRLYLQQFPDTRMPFVGNEVKDCFEEIRQEFTPDLIFTHNSHDAHQDHRLISELTWNAFRDHVILEYEIPKYDGDLGRPSVFVPLADDHYRQKVQYLMECFTSQRSKRWFDESTFLALMRLRGMECNAPSGYAEAFYSRKLVL